MYRDATGFTIVHKLFLGICCTQESIHKLFSDFPGRKFLNPAVYHCGCKKRMRHSKTIRFRISHGANQLHSFRNKSL